MKTSERKIDTYIKQITNRNIEENQMSLQYSSLVHRDKSGALKQKMSEYVESLTKNFAKTLDNDIEFISNSFKSKKAREKFNQMIESPVKIFKESPFKSLGSASSFNGYSLRQIIEAYIGYFIAKNDGLSLDEYINLINHYYPFAKHNVRIEKKPALLFIKKLKKALDSEERERSSQPGND